MTRYEIDEVVSRKIAGFGFICACMVVFLHVGMDLPQMSLPAVNFLKAFKRILCMCVPMFFIFSGFLIAGHISETGWWINELRKRIRSLMVPYLLWNFVHLVFFLTVGSIAIRVGMDFKGHSWLDFHGVETLVSAIGFYPLKFPSLEYSWFLRGLIVFVVVVPLLVSVFRRLALGAVAIVAAVTTSSFIPYMLADDLDFASRFLALSWVEGALCFGVGIWLRCNAEKLTVFRKKIQKCGWIMVFLGVTMPIVHVVWGAEIPIMVSSLMLICGLWLVILDMHLPKVLTSAAFPMFLLHKFFLFADHVLECTVMLPAVRTSNCMYVLRALAIIACCVLFSKIMRTLCPRLSSIAFGGR